MNRGPLADDAVPARAVSAGALAADDAVTREGEVIRRMPPRTT